MRRACASAVPVLAVKSGYLQAVIYTEKYSAVELAERHFKDGKYTSIVKKRQLRRDLKGGMQ